MRIPSPLFQQLAVGRSGAVMEEGDGELTLPSTLQGVFEPGAPLFSFANPAQTFRDSFMSSNVNSGTGVIAALDELEFTLGAGIWNFFLTWRWMFTGTTNVAKIAELRMVDPASNMNSIFASAFVSGAQSDNQASFNLALARDGFSFRLIRSASVAGDVFDLQTSYLVKKLA